MNITKQLEFFDPRTIDCRVHIIGCGSVGSTIAENLVRCGVEKITLYDFDVVESHNLSNQMFRVQDIGRAKVDALVDILKEINPDVDLKVQPDGWNGKLLSGYVFLAVDSIEIRRNFVESHMNHPFVRGVFDVRTVLTSAQHYAANWTDEKQKADLLASMQFSHDEAKEETPTSACGITLGVATTVRIISAIAVENFINLVKSGKCNKFVQFGCEDSVFHFLCDEF